MGSTCGDLHSVQDRGESGQCAHQDEDCKCDDAWWNAGEPGRFRIATHRVDEAAGREVSGRPRERREQDESDCDERELTSLLAQPEPLHVRRQVDELSLLLPPQFFPQDHHRSQSNDDARQPQTGDQPTVHCAEQPAKSQAGERAYRERQFRRE